MWEGTYSQVFKDVKKEDIWRVWRDVNNWHVWDTDIEYAQLEGGFTAGSKIILKPKTGPKVKIQLIEVEKNKRYIDCTKFFGAKMYGIHTMQEEDGALRLTTNIKVTGLLSFLWMKLVAQNIVASLPEQTANLVKIAKNE